MATTPNTDFTSGQILTAAQQNNFPRGVMGYFISTANSAVTTTTADITGATATFTAVANRLYKATLAAYWNQSDAGATITFLLTDGSNSILNQRIHFASNNNTKVQSTVTFLCTSTAGSSPRKIRAATSGGTATIFGATADTQFYSFSIEDMGPV